MDGALIDIRDGEYTSPVQGQFYHAIVILQPTNDTPTIQPTCTLYGTLLHDRLNVNTTPISFPTKYTAWLTSDFYD